MNFKIDTKEKMHVIMVEEENLSANMAEDLKSLCKSFFDKPVKNVIINLAKVKHTEKPVLDAFADLQQLFAEKNASLVYCEMKKDLNTFLRNEEMEDVLNITPTESEAWDIVQMEEIEREFLD